MMRMMLMEATGKAATLLVLEARVLRVKVLVLAIWMVYAKRTRDWKSESPACFSSSNCSS